MAVPPFDLMLITEPALEDPVRFVRRALIDVEPQRVAVQLRAKAWSGAQRLDAALAIAEITRATQSTLLINGDLEACRVAQADGVHLPSQGISVAEARAMLGRDRWIGVSCHDHAGVIAADRDAADYVVLSPWGDVPGKGAALGSAQFACIAAATSRPVIALGGIGLDDLPRVIAAGATGFAVIRQAHIAPKPSAWIRDALATITAEHARQNRPLD